VYCLSCGSGGWTQGECCRAVPENQKNAGLKNRRIKAIKGYSLPMPRRARVVIAINHIILSSASQSSGGIHTMAGFSGGANDMLLAGHVLYAFCSVRIPLFVSGKRFL